MSYIEKLVKNSHLLKCGKVLECKMLSEHEQKLYLNKNVL